MLRLLGLFDRPADGDAIAALRAEPVIPELTESLIRLAEDDWQWTLSNLRECGLLAASDVPGTLDTHPLVRAYFGDRLAERHPEAWRVGQSRLYEHFKGVAKELPETIEEMMPLYAAVVHGCRAGKQKEAYEEVYRPRIRRGNEHYQLHKLGAFGADLVALSGFFVRPWEEPVPSLTKDVQAWLLNTAGFELRALGRLTEAVQPMRAAAEQSRALENWTEAAIQTGNLSELFLTLGEVTNALASAEESVKLADRTGETFLRMATRTGLADALHQAGRLEESRSSFREAEALQAERQPSYPRLYSIQGYRYCDLLLSRASSAEIREAQERATESIKIAKQNYWLLDVALDHLTLGRAHLGLALSSHGSADFASAAEHLDRAVDDLWRAGAEEFIVRGLLARAALRRVVNDLPGARADLDEAHEIAERGGMRLHICDVHIERTRQHLASGDIAEARRQLAAAKMLVEACGYRRRAEEVSVLEDRPGEDL